MHALLLAPLLATLALHSPAPEAQPAQYTFQRAPLFGELVGSLEDLRGRPALFEFWGTRCPSCREAAVPAAVALQERWGNDLQVVFVEAQGSGVEESARLALNQRWFGGRAIWTSEIPVRPPGRSLPAFVLLGADGVPLLSGNPLAHAREIERLVEEEVRGRRSVPANVPDELRAAWTAHLRGRTALALELLRAARSDADAPADVQQRLEQAAATLRKKIEAPLAQARAWIENGAYERVEAILAEVDVAARADDALAKQVKELTQRFQSEVAPAERAAARELARRLGRFFAAGGDAPATAELEAFVSRAHGTRAAERAQVWVKIAKGPQ